MKLMSTRMPPVQDPDNVPEIFCEGRFSVTVAPVSTLTFTHMRPKPEALLADNTTAPEMEAIVRVRLLLPMSSLVALRDVLNKVVGANEAAVAVNQSTTGHSIN
jgi:hypothetical protein